MIFDYDGTIVDTLEFHARSIGGIIEDCGGKKELEVLRTYVGKSILYFFEKTLPQEKHGEATEKIAEMYLDIPQKYWDVVSIIENAKETLEKLREKGIKIALVTNSHWNLVEASLKYFELEEYFDWVMPTDEKGYNKEERLNKLMDITQIDPKEILYVGDGPGDIIDSKKVGIDVALIINETSWFKEDEAFLEKWQPTYIIEDIGEILEF